MLAMGIALESTAVTFLMNSDQRAEDGKASGKAFPGQKRCMTFAISEAALSMLRRLPLWDVGLKVHREGSRATSPVLEDAILGRESQTLGPVEETVLTRRTHLSATLQTHSHIGIIAHPDSSCGLNSHFPIERTVRLPPT